MTTSQPSAFSHPQTAKNRRGLPPQPHNTRASVRLRGSARSDGGGVQLALQLGLQGSAHLPAGVELLRNSPHSPHSPDQKKTDGHISNAWVRYRAMNLWGGTCSKWGFVWRSEFVGDSCPNGAFMDMLKGSSVRIRGSVERGRTTPAVPSDYQTSN